MSNVIETAHLTKRYGSRTVVDDLSLRVPHGCVYGFLGPNGSGKSTTMKMLLSLIRPTHGDVLIMGQPMTRTSRRRLLAHVGSLIEAPPGYGHLTGRENMRIMQRLLDLPQRQIDWAVDTVRLRSQMGKRVRNFSLGMKQRLGIALALARQPQLLILDEPTNGLDPAGIEEIRELLRNLAASGVTVMVSSHLLGEIDKTATTLGILSEGRLLFQGTRSQLMAASRPDVIIETSDPRFAQSMLRQSLDCRTDGRATRIAQADDAATARAVSTLVHAGVDVFEVRRDDQTLEDVFIDLTKAGGL
ncbi:MULTISPECIES: ABC transporter ATP-binding protein [Brevibacterium]|uniref:ABC-2 type transport system ATP-binding protein n=1 Tax=Brevibacterium aurantiacum TaxID=273384 RepID=A0A2H1J8E5_BREAU|nr:MULTISPECIES: ABC transporter ATP-binding protein [Brevibacterium]TGD10671.1 ABC transporter ATP-binding protein [Brevibacterium sp. S111]SMX83699.1 ABC-2 type transport system ATP-binding protein [Brevibacterium aurantiacum]